MKYIYNNGFPYCDSCTTSGCTLSPAGIASNTANIHSIYDSNTTEPSWVGSSTNTATQFRTTPTTISAGSQYCFNSALKNICPLAPNIDYAKHTFLGLQGVSTTIVTPPDPHAYPLRNGSYITNSGSGAAGAGKIITVNASGTGYTTSTLPFIPAISHSINYADASKAFVASPSSTPASAGVYIVDDSTSTPAVGTFLPVAGFTSAIAVCRLGTSGQYLVIANTNSTFLFNTTGLTATLVGSGGVGFPSSFNVEALNGEWISMGSNQYMTPMGNIVTVNPTNGGITVPSNYSMSKNSLGITGGMYGGHVVDHSNRVFIHTGIGKVYQMNATGDLLWSRDFDVVSGVSGVELYNMKISNNLFYFGGSLIDASTNQFPIHIRNTSGTFVYGHPRQNGFAISGSGAIFMIASNLLHSFSSTKSFNGSPSTSLIGEVGSGGQIAYTICTTNTGLNTVSISPASHPLTIS